MFVTNWISTTKIQKISEITNFFRHYFLSRTEVFINLKSNENEKRNTQENSEFRHYRSHRRSLCLLCAELPVVSTL